MSFFRVLGHLYNSTEIKQSNDLELGAWDLGHNVKK
jgi:hypothetical protein